jgi:hypothetical protein
MFQCCNLVHGNLAFLHDELKACLCVSSEFSASARLKARPH